MKKISILLCAFILLAACQTNSSNEDFTTLFEKSNGTETPEYAAVIDYYKKLTNSYSELSMYAIGETDSGNPLHLIVFNVDGKMKLEDIKNSPKNRVLINNGIHPGESDGIDASMMLLRNLAQNDSLKALYKNSIIAFIPIYNIGGSLNRNSHTRTNQNGPKEYGFRGNARNFDLNRDFIKQDTKNAAAFAAIFHSVNPDVFIDNHVSNGADYQYALTHLYTQHNKLGGDLGDFLESTMRPEMEASLEKKGIIITPYVNVWGDTPEAGFSQFYDSPRYSTGYTTLFNTFGLMVETHMLKPYKIRVEQTYELMLSAFDFAEKNSAKVKDLRKNAVANIIAKKTYPIAFRPDRSKPTTLQFKGYEATYLDSKVTNGKRLFYDRSQPFTKETNYFNNFEVTKEISIPKAYILAQGWHKVIERLENNKIEFTRLSKDTTLTVTVNHIDKYNSGRSPFEGHYLHNNTTVLSSTQTLKFKKGDLYIPTHQNGIRYLLETLEAEATDSFFNWNFFDTVLQQKEGYSAYVFEDLAEQFLSENPEIKAQFDTKMVNDTDFAKNARMQLNWVFKQSPHYEKAYLRLPIFKIY